MKKLLIFITAICFLSPVTVAQLWRARRVEVTAGIGTTQFFGDIGGYPNEKNILGLRDFTFRQTRFNINTSIRYRITEDLSARVNLMSGLFHSTDSRGSNTARGFESGTFFVETSLIAEYYFIKNKEENSFIFLNKNESTLRSFFGSLDFYAFAGIGGLAYHVKPNEILAPLVIRTGGFTEVIPMGLGASMVYSAKLNFGVELGGRFCYSDNLEGYTTGFRNDVYYILNFTVTYKIKTKDKGHPKNR